MVERSLSMREAAGSMPASSIFIIVALCENFGNASVIIRDSSQRRSSPPSS